MAGKLTQKAALARIRALGLTARVVDGEWRVNVPGASEASAYYTTDAEDAVNTAAAMHRMMEAGVAVSVRPNRYRGPHPFAHVRRKLAARADVTDPDALAAYIARRLRGRNPTTLSESDALDMALVALIGHDVHEQEAQRLVEAAQAKLTDLLAQVRRGVHQNPTLLVASGNPRRRIARKVLSIAYVHDQDGEEYEHDFTEDRDHGAVVAYVERGGRRVVLEATDGQPIVKDY